MIAKIADTTTLSPLQFTRLWALLFAAVF